MKCSSAITLLSFSSKADAPGSDMAGQTGIRVLVVDDGEGLWGSQRYLLRIAPLLEKQGFELFLLSPEGSALGALWEASGRPVEALPESQGLHSGRWETRLGKVSELLRYSARVASRTLHIARSARRLQIDIIVGNSCLTHLDSALAARLAGTRAVLHLHEQVDGRNLASRKVAVVLAARALSVSEQISKDLSGYPRRKVTVVRNGVDPDAFLPGPPDEALRGSLVHHQGDQLVACIGRIDRAKQVDHIVEAMARIAEDVPTAELVIIGAPSEKDGYSAEVRKLADDLLGDRVVFLDERDDVDSILRAVDVVVFAGRIEGLSLGLLEAMSAGRAVVAYKASGVSEVIEDGVSGLVVPMGNKQVLADRLKTLLLDGELRSVLGRNSAASIRRDFTLDKQVEGNVSVLRQAHGQRELRSRPR
jgi:glycosyltransferase involved in cell wall biosynthesis